MTNHKHTWVYYDKSGNSKLKEGEVWECVCGARQIRYLAWEGDLEE